MSASVVGLAAWAAAWSLGAGPVNLPMPPPPAGVAAKPDARSMPWANVSPKDEAEAKRLMELGNRALYEGLPKEAEGYYVAALKHWDHPAIHYNYAQALLRLFRLLECHEHLEAAMKYGPAPLEDPAKYRSALSTLATVEAELTRLEIKCEEPGAKVSLDDRKDLFECPRTYAEWMLPGPHVLRISKPGLVSREKPLALPKGKRISVPFNIYTEDQMKRSRSRWPWWFPWSVVGTGLAAGGVGAAVHVRARNALISYDQAILGCAQDINDQGFQGCSPDRSQEYAPMRQQGESLQRGAWGAYLGAGALIASGLVLVAFNTPENYIEDPDLELKMAVTPWMAPGSGGVGLSFAF